MLSTDYYYIERVLWRIRNARSRNELTFAAGMAWGYLCALSAHCGISVSQRERLDALWENVQQYGMVTVNDLEIQGWA